MKAHISPHKLAVALTEIAKDRNASVDARIDSLALLNGDAERRYSGALHAIAPSLLRFIARLARGPAADVVAEFANKRVVSTNPARKRRSKSAAPVPEWANVSAAQLELRQVTPGKAVVIRSVEDVVRQFAGLMDLHHEEFWIGVMRGKKMLLRYMISRGGVSNSSVYFSEMLRVVLLAQGDGIVMAHCHPSGHALPSPDDLEVERRAAENLALLGLQAYDSLILADQRFAVSYEKSRNVITVPDPDSGERREVGYFSARLHGMLETDDEWLY